MNGNFVANPMSRKNIDIVAWRLRQWTGTEKQLEFPIVPFFENFLKELCQGFDYHYPSVSEMPNEHGATFPVEKIIHIREDVYERACEGEGRDRLTIAHEIGHLLLHDTSSIALNRMDPNIRVPAYRDPEWQANVFGGSLLMPPPLIRGLSVWEVVEQCKVSYNAAKYQLQKIA